MTAALDLLDLDPSLSEEERQIRDVVRQLVDDRVRPHVADWYEDGKVPARELAREFGKLGLLGMHLTGYGCAGASAVAYGLACQELEAGDSGLRSLVSVQGSLAMYAIWRYGSEEQKQRWLPSMATGEAIGCFGLTEPDHGSDPASMATRARRDGDDWVLTGGKMWITNAPIADVAVIWARTDDGVRGFAVPMDTPGVTAREIRRKMSLRASVTGEIVLDDVRLPADAQLPEAVGLKAPLSCLTEARYGIVWGAVGAARDCLETTLAYASSRTQFGRPLAGFQLTQAKLADMAVELVKGQLLALHLGRLADARRLRPEQVSVGKLNNVREALAIARQCRTILGANGVSGEYPVMRHANNLESVLTYEGTSEIHQLVIGQRLTGLSAFA
ncbi:acyl-CoA dehydrogenase family protein [Micromonospora saelicesensis]|uniref:Glutaryl-CoA dehydrogenase n=1 Tax=Micromonospora saelicesensis TaxID=285676 RepID=A0A1C4UNC4_9ACTN|nr:acyl-CoA dehydrogenase family protein [Micromonospora saelicesensis]RAO03934.1 Glutaryl-CoA dehydrogenase (ETF) [Micromonospora saelicesensis]RAO29803.1 Glutaryl-CoA dehydrogenase (ETF) [Micromonospora saelicesensis]RAO43227.1 Glutaryl-CoA dehydrogenase (ETF) [Micromonospora saelicesensis]RAO54131.1 Glutaryl-CoA dehydrogenase (ETF) [Micromonospora saelicesensis]SCE73140.1 glutaryl-CoA dehydrogenase [Micromonospora saelicesensis]